MSEGKVVRLSNSYTLAEVAAGCMFYEAVLSGKGAADLRELAKNQHLVSFFRKAIDMRTTGRKRLLAEAAE